MKLVIDIDEEDYNFIKRQVRDGITNPLKICISNGIPLPKGHGRIIDESKINKVYEYTDEAIASNIKAISTIITGTDAPTIIEKESE